MKKKFIPSLSDITSSCRAVTHPGSYSILPEGNRVVSILPGFENTVSKVLATPAIGAKFVQHELIMQSGGHSPNPVKDPFEHFVFVLEGNLVVTIDGKENKLEKGGFVFLPEDVSFSFKNTGDKPNRLFWTKKRFQPAGDLKPGMIIGNEKDVEAVPEDTYVEKHLIPYDNDPAYDMAFNLLIFDVGIYFSYVESHIMEHGLYMLDGSGIYWLNGDYIEVQKNDYIYMAPYVPQFFYATGWETPRYLLYKDINRDYDTEL